MTRFYISCLSMIGVLYFVTPTETADLGGFYIHEAKFCKQNTISLTCAAEDEILMILGVTFARTNNRCSKEKCSRNLVSVNETLYKSVVHRCSGRRVCEVDKRLLQSLSCDDKGHATQFRTSHICVPNTSVIPMCANKTMTVNKGMVWTNNYPRLAYNWHQLSSGSLQPLSVLAEHKCQCEMKVEDDKIRLQMVEMDLTGSCSQELAIQSMDDGQHRRQYNCTAKYQTKTDFMKKEAASFLLNLKSGHEGRGRFALVFRKVSSVAVSSNPKVKVKCRHYSSRPPPQITQTPDVTQNAETQTSLSPPSSPPLSSPSSPPLSSPSPLPPLPPSSSLQPSTISMIPTSQQSQSNTLRTPLPTSAVPTMGDTAQPQQQSNLVVIGGSIGGAVVAIILVCVGVFIVLRWRKSSKENSLFDNIPPSYNNKGYETDFSENMYQDPQLSHDYQDPKLTHDYQDPQLTHGYQDPQLTHDYQDPQLSHDYQDPTVGSDTATYEAAAHNHKKDNVYDELNNGMAFDNAIYRGDEAGRKENIYDSLEERHVLYESQPNNQMESNPTYHELNTAQYESHAVNNNEPCYFELQSDKQAVEPSAPSMDTINRTDQEPTYLDLENI